MRLHFAWTIEPGLTKEFVFQFRDSGYDDDEVLRMIPKLPFGEDELIVSTDNGDEVIWCNAPKDDWFRDLWFMFLKQGFQPAV